MVEPATRATVPAIVPSTSLAYRAAVRIGTSLVPVAGLFSEKVRRSHAGRRGLLPRFAAWARSHREASRPLVWVHAPSVGEGLQADAVLRRLRTQYPDWQYAYTHYSPSAERFAAGVGADFADYLPYDLPTDVDAALDALRPSVLVFSKLDVWPELATRAAGRGIAVALIAGTVSPGSGRLRWPARSLLVPGYGAITAAAAISEHDAGRLEHLGIPRSRISVVGDPRFDSVAERQATVSPDDPLLAWGRDAPTLVAGSTWPADEAALLGAFAAVRASHRDARLILVPHEPSPDHLQQAEQTAAAIGLPQPVRLSAATEPGPVLLVDRIGVLATLYGCGVAAYVGGGFGRAGLHSVLEPAAWGVPVTFGPRWTDSRDAHLLLDRGAAVAIGTVDPAAARDRLTAIWNRWLVDATFRREQGRLARQVVEEGRGASDRSARMISDLVEDQRRKL